MKWNAHIDKAVSKASSMIGFLRRNLGNAPEKVKIQAYKSLVRPHVEYCSSVWDPHTKRYIQKVETVQRRAARFITNDYGRESSVTNMLTNLELPSLQQRRLNNRLTMMHKIVHNKVDLSFEKHLQFDVPDPSTVKTRNHNPLTLKVPSTKTDCFQKTFFPNTARDWNALPYLITSIEDTASFNRAISSEQLD